ncbi:Lipocalin-like domain-containing protein [Exophiala viscosa]|uniref:Lipocalin-like domain-containing protein n=1 Tax=Exophiala viscosa TaxID=2486360 RepID=A0AAN6DRA8_9EURO|nr:Lipocalin-like domain-containing protein [Exophiala viscosa]KAI1624816.1 Lipocalin-like domain-containing protein [Exophiala viscosa]
MPSFLSRVLGAWELLTYTATNVEDGNDVIYPMGENCKGQIVYTNDGYMAALLQWGDVEPYKDGSKRGTTQELADAAKKTMSYCGPFHLDEQPGNKQKIIHHAKIALPPNYINTLQLRVAEMTEDDGQLFLTLGPEGLTEDKGVKRIVRLKWRKLPQNDTSKAPRDGKL